MVGLVGKVDGDMKLVYIEKTEETITEIELRQRALDGSLGFTMRITEISDELLNDYGIFVVRVEDTPFYDPYNENLVVQPTKLINGEYVRTFLVVEKTEEEKDIALTKLRLDAVTYIGNKHKEIIESLKCNSSVGVLADNRLVRNDREVLKILIDKNEFPIHFRDANNTYIDLSESDANILYKEMGEQILSTNQNKWELQEEIAVSDSDRILQILREY